MFGSHILEVAISVVFLYVLLSLILTVVMEAIDGLLKVRAQNLERGIRELVGDAGLAKALYEHSLIAGLFRGSYEGAKPGGWITKTDLPSYIPSRNFALALLDLHARKADVAGDRGGADPAVSFASVEEILGALRREASDDPAKLRVGLERWFDGAMDRVSGWHKRRTQAWLAGLAILMVMLLNIDTIAIVRHLSRNDTARQALVSQAEEAVVRATRPRST